MCCPKTGLSLCDRLHSGRFDREVILCAFDLLELAGDDMRFLPFEQRTGPGTAPRRDRAQRAHRSRRRDLSYEHAGKIEAQLKAELADLTARAEAADAAEGVDGMSIPDE